MKTERLFEITFILLEKRTVTAKELAERFEVSVRTIYRDLDILSACGIPIYTEQGRHGGIHLMEQYSLNKTLLTDSEQSQVVMALQSLKATGQEDVSAPLSKLKGIFRKDFDDWIEIDFSSWSNSDKERELFSLIRESILRSSPMRFAYINTKGESSIRVVEPYKLVFKGQNWYLFAYCRTKKDFRFFKLSRMEEPRTEEGSFYRETHPASESNRYHKEQNETITLKLKIDAVAGYRVMDELKDFVIEFDEENYIIEWQTERNEWLFTYLLGYGDRLEILEPEEIKTEYSSLLQKMIEKNHKCEKI